MGREDSKRGREESKGREGGQQRGREDSKAKAWLGLGIGEQGSWLGQQHPHLLARMGEEDRTAYL